MKGESDVTRSIIHELHSSDIKGEQMEGKVVLLEVSVMKLVLGISKEIKWKVKVVLLEVSLMNFILGMSKKIKWNGKVVLLEVSLTNFILQIGSNRR